MRALTVTVLAGLVGLVALIGVDVAGARSSAPSFVQATEKEWQITLSRTSVKKGKVFVEAVNFGTDAHNLVILGPKKGARPVTLPQIDPNGRTEKALTLTPGRYTLWCSLPGHRERGMKTSLLVRA